MVLIIFTPFNEHGNFLEPILVVNTISTRPYLSHPT